MSSQALAAPRVAAAVGVTAAGVTAGGTTWVFEQAGSTSTAADPAIAQNALAVYRMRINLVHLPGNTAERDERAGLGSRYATRTSALAMLKFL